MPIKASCHCGATQFEVSEAPTSLTECNCTFCFKRGMLWAYYSPEQVDFIKNDRTTAYTRDESTHKHHHCSVCGCGAYNELRCSWGENGPDFSAPRLPSMRGCSTISIWQPYRLSSSMAGICGKLRKSMWQVEGAQHVG